MSNQSSVSFNLIDQPWIPVRTLKGKLAEVSLKDVLLHAEDYLDIEDDSPLIVISLYRFILAVLHRALEGPADIGFAKRWYKEGFPKDKIERYLEKWYDRFDLFHPEYPFFQIPDLPNEEDKQINWKKLAPELSSGNNYTLSDHSHVYDGEVCSPSYAGRLLITTQTFSFAGGVSSSNLINYTNSPSATCALFLALDVNLKLTLSRNLVSYPNDKYVLDMPTWERTDLTYKNLLTTQQSSCNGITSLYTWLSRSIKLNPVDLGEDKVIIKTLSIASGLNFDEKKSQVLDPMVCYMSSENGEMYRIRLSEEKRIWRDFTSLLQSLKGYSKTPYTLANSNSLPNTSMLTPISIYGVTNTQAKIENWLYESYCLNPRLFGDEGIELIGKLIKQSNKSANCLKKATIDYAVIYLSSGSTLTDLGEIKNHVRELLSESSATKDNEAKIKSLTKYKDEISNNPTYWSYMAQAFHRVLNKITDELTEEKEDDIYAYWDQEQRIALQKAWHTVEVAAGTGSRALKALSKAGGLIGHRINELKQVEVTVETEN